jgi:L-aminopeptidase/D-esterase-like protein
MRYLEEKGVGYKTSAGVVPIVPAAVIFDLPFGGNPKVRPTADCGYRAATDATNGPVREGNVGVGAGATVGKLGRAEDHRTPMKAGVGSASITLPSGLIVSAIVAVNAVGDIIDPASGKVVAGVRNSNRTLADARRCCAVLQWRLREPAGDARGCRHEREAHEDAGRPIRADGRRRSRARDRAVTRRSTEHCFRPRTGTWDGAVEMTTIGALAADVLAEAIVRAATQADSLGGLVSARQTGSIPIRFK